MTSNAQARLCGKVFWSCSGRRVACVLLPKQPTRLPLQLLDAAMRRPYLCTAVSTTVLPRIRPVAKFFFEGEKKFFVKGITYGPFKPDAEGNYLGQPEQVDVDLALMRNAGLNVVRIYHAPPRWFLDRCAVTGMRVLVTLPWAKHIEFLRERSTRRGIVETIRAAVSAYAGHPAIFGYLVGNEISSTMVRWLGARRVVEFVEELSRIWRVIALV